MLYDVLTLCLSTSLYTPLTVEANFFLIMRKNLEREFF